MFVTLFTVFDKIESRFESNQVTCIPGTESKSLVAAPFGSPNKSSKQNSTAATPGGGDATDSRSRSAVLQIVERISADCTVKSRGLSLVVGKTHICEKVVGLGSLSM